MGLKRGLPLTIVTGRTKPTLRGERLLLRPISVADTDEMFAATQDVETKRLTGTRTSFTREQIEAWCARVATADDRIDLAILARTTGEFLGEVVLNELDQENRSAAFRIALSAGRHFGKGYGTEAAGLILEFAFDVLELNRVSLEVFTFNPRALHVYEKLGFRREGRLREALWMDGEFHDAIVMGLLRREFVPPMRAEQDHDSA